MQENKSGKKKKFAGPFVENTIKAAWGALRAAPGKRLAG